MTRILAAIVLLLTCTCSSWAGPADKKLNVLFLIGDDHAAHVMGTYGNKLVRTPGFDKLAAGGMRFDRAYCNAPVCTPSRQSFLTGKYPRTVGVTQLRSALSPEEDTLAKMFKRGGYHTAAIGKMHFNSNLTHGFDLRLDLPDHKKWLDKKGKRPLPEGLATLPAWKPFKDHARTWLNSDALPLGMHDDDMAGSWYVHKAAEYLHEHKREPFFLIVSFHEPHSPFHFPFEFRGRHDPGRFAVPAVGPGDAFQVPAIFRDLTDKEKQGIAASYYTSVEYLDRNIGMVLDALEKLGLAENTLVIYIGDHGYCLGHHGRFEKHSLWEEAVRAPLLVRLPGRVPAGKSTPALTEFIDIAPTLLELCKQPLPQTLQGKSLVPVLTGKAAAHREHVIVEYAENEEALVRSERWAFMYGSGKRQRQDGYETGKPLPGRMRRLYDMLADPGQTMNVADKAENVKVVARFTELLAEHLRRTARQPELLPAAGGDLQAFIDAALTPRDLEWRKDKK